MARRLGWSARLNTSSQICAAKTKSTETLGGGAAAGGCRRAAERTEAGPRQFLACGVQAERRQGLAAGRGDRAFAYLINAAAAQSDGAAPTCGSAGAHLGDAPRLRPVEQAVRRRALHALLRRIELVQPLTVRVLAQACHGAGAASRGCT